jgi:NDP-sugar pyrophosphorylase family protein
MKERILTAGLYTRWGDLSDYQPKTLLDLGGGTLLGKRFRHFESAGTEETYLVVGYDPASVRHRHGNRTTSKTLLKGTMLNRG